MALPRKFDQSLTHRLREQLENDEYIKMLGARTIFRDLRPTELPLPLLEEISEAFIPVPLKKGDKLDLKQSDAAYEIISGYVKIFDRPLRADETGKKHDPRALIAWRIPGELLGDFRFMDPETMLDQIEATDECLLLKMPNDLLRRLGETYWQVYHNIACNLAAKAIKTRVRAQILQQPKIDCKIAMMFLELLKERGSEELTQDGKKVEVVRGAFHLKDIAAFIGYDYSGTQKGLHDLIAAGLLARYQSHRSGRYICKKEGLADYLKQGNCTHH